jgi:hypothetical protein
MSDWQQFADIVSQISPQLIFVAGCIGLWLGMRHA